MSCLRLSWVTLSALDVVQFQSLFGPAEEERRAGPKRDWNWTNVGDRTLNAVRKMYLGAHGNKMHYNH